MGRSCQERSNRHRNGAGGAETAPLAVDRGRRAFRTAPEPVLSDVPPPVGTHLARDAPGPGGSAGARRWRRGRGRAIARDGS